MAREHSTITQKIINEMVTNSSLLTLMKSKRNV